MYWHKNSSGITCTIKLILQLPDMNPTVTLIVDFLAVWLIIQASAIRIADKWDMKRLRRQLHDPRKGLMEQVCDTCKSLVDAIQHLARSNLSEDTVAYVANELCVDLNVQDSLICNGIVPEFKVRDYYNCSQLHPFECNLYSYKYVIINSKLYLVQLQVTVIAL